MNRRFLYGSFIVSLTLTCSILCHAQNQANIWHFGNYAGIDFNSGTAVPILGSAMETLEGCASIADAQGNLLFYTDGVTVWDRNHQVMPNGTGLNALLIAHETNHYFQ